MDDDRGRGGRAAVEKVYMEPRVVGGDASARNYVDWWGPGGIGMGDDGPITPFGIQHNA